MSEPQKVDEFVWEIGPEDGMRVPGRIFANDALMEAVMQDKASSQVANVAHLPGIVEASFAMPDIHWGYGFPIGGVAATKIDEGGVVSPGGVGFDICCGVRLIASNLDKSDFTEHRDSIMGELDQRIPRGIGKGAVAKGGLIEDVLTRGAAAAVEGGYGYEADLERCEEYGTSEGAELAAVSEKAINRGQDQLGSLGAGNHFLEVQVVDEIFDTEAARVFGLEEDMVVVMIHCGSRGLGHQTCTDQLKIMGDAMKRHAIEVPDRQLACVPVDSKEGQRYLEAMAAASNFAWANRHILAHETRQAFAAGIGTIQEKLGMDLVFDVAHNLAKVETHVVDGRETEVCVHHSCLRAGPPRPAFRSEIGRATGPDSWIDGNCIVGLERRRGKSSFRFSSTRGRTCDEQEEGEVEILGVPGP